MRQPGPVALNSTLCGWSRCATRFTLLWSPSKCDQEPSSELPLGFCWCPHSETAATQFLFICKWRNNKHLSWGMCACGNSPPASLCACWLPRCWGKRTQLYNLRLRRKPECQRQIYRDGTDCGSSYSRAPTTYRRLSVWAWAPCEEGILDKAAHLQREEVRRGFRVHHLLLFQGITKSLRRCCLVLPAGLSSRYANRQRITAWWQTTRTFSCRSSSMMTGSRRWTRSS